MTNILTGKVLYWCHEKAQRQVHVAIKEAYRELDCPLSNGALSNMANHIMKDIEKSLREAGAAAMHVNISKMTKQLKSDIKHMLQEEFAPHEEFQKLGLTDS
jgi:hypothetical protein